MFKSTVGFLSIFSLLASCAAPPQSARPQASAGSASAPATVSTAPAADDDNYETVWVPHPIGSMIGGGAERVPKRTIAGSDEKALLGNINRLNAAAGTKDERPYVVAAVSRVTGVSAQALQAQQDTLRLRFGELCAINTIARGNSSKVKEIATLKSRGQSWTNLANANGLSIASVVQAARNANNLTVDSYTSAADRQEGGQRKLHDLGVRPQVRPGG